MGAAKKNVQILSGTRRLVGNNGCFSNRGRLGCFLAVGRGPGRGCAARIGLPVQAMPVFGRQLVGGLAPAGDHRYPLLMCNTCYVC